MWLRATVLSQIVQMVAQARRSRAPMQRTADVVAGYFVVAAVAVALPTFIAWDLFGPAELGLRTDQRRGGADHLLPLRALGLAAPMSIMVATGMGATQGVLFLHAAAIENLSDGLTTALAVGKRLGIDEVHGEVKPADKLKLVGRLQSKGRVVAMAGDSDEWRPDRRTWYDAEGGHLRPKQLELYGKLP